MSTKKKLEELAELDDLSLTQVVNNLIVAEYSLRRQDIMLHRGRMKNRDSERTREINE
jgi:hypothetical protein